MIFVTIWGLRPSLYLLWRNWHKGEDYRYQKWRQDEGDRWWWYSLFKAFLLQGLSTRANCSPAGCGATQAPPNCFSDAAQWWAYYLLALAAGGWFPWK
jgi:steroid 5-alpha reductase family enzyme